MARRKRVLPSRRASIIVWAAFLIILFLALVAFGVDVGYMVLARTQLQAAVDSSAVAAAASMYDPQPEVLAIAQEYAGYHGSAGRKVELDADDVEFGIWDATARQFTPTKTTGNAIRVTARQENASLFFGWVLGRTSFSPVASAVATANPRDIVFVVDLSGSMNDDTEPAWATQTITTEFSKQGYPTVGIELMESLYRDFGYGTFPGQVEHIGTPLGVLPDKYAYADMTADIGPLAKGVPNQYRIQGGDNEKTRKTKAYSWIIDNQIAKVMPKAKPTPDSGKNYAYWEAYLDYIIEPVSIKAPSNNSGNNKNSNKNKNKGNNNKNNGGGSGGGGGSTPKPPPIGRIDLPAGGEWFAVWQDTSGLRPGDGRAPLFAGDQHDFALASAAGWQAALVPVVTSAVPRGTPPVNRGTIPANQSGDRIDKFNNPNIYTFPNADKNLPKSLRNKLGYITYVQFMMDFGRDLKPDGKTHVPLAANSPDCPYHQEDTAGGAFSFPPREQPAHAARRSLIAAMQIIKDRNENVPDLNQRDWVSIVTFDTLSGGGPVIAQPLTGDYEAAMLACTTLQSVGDKGATTATEAGLLTAKKHLEPADKGGAGRNQTDKIVVLLTDGVPNQFVSSTAEIDDFMQQNPDSNYYGNGAYWYDAALMQAVDMNLRKWAVYPVGLGLGTDYDFMDRMARGGGTADEEGKSSRGSGNPAEYEQRLTEIFKDIISAPKVRLVD
jgi:Flp pilus assembly protein TadG